MSVDKATPGSPLRVSAKVWNLARQLVEADLVPERLGDMWYWPTQARPLPGGYDAPVGERIDEADQTQGPWLHIGGWPGPAPEDKSVRNLALVNTALRWAHWPPPDGGICVAPGLFGFYGIAAVGRCLTDRPGGTTRYHRVIPRYVPDNPERRYWHTCTGGLDLYGYSVPLAMHLVLAHTELNSTTGYDVVKLGASCNRTACRGLWFPRRGCIFCLSDACPHIEICDAYIVHPDPDTYTIADPPPQMPLPLGIDQCPPSWELVDASTNRWRGYVLRPTLEQNSWWILSHNYDHPSDDCLCRQGVLSYAIYANDLHFDELEIELAPGTAPEPDGILTIPECQLGEYGIALQYDMTAPVFDEETNMVTIRVISGGYITSDYVNCYYDVVPSYLCVYKLRFFVRCEPVPAFAGGWLS